MHRSPISKNIFPFVVVLAILLILFIVFLNPFSSPSSVRDFLSFDSCRGLDRSSYTIPPAVFSDLPSPPRCFASFVDAYHSNTFTDGVFFSEDFFLQPEFFPGFVDSGLPVWESPDPFHYGAIGYGYFPAEHRVFVSRGSTAHVRFFVRSGYGVRSYQGMRLLPKYRVENNSNSVSIQLDSNSANGFLLGPTFPKFSSSWVHAVDVTITLAPDAPQGDIPVTFETAPVSVEAAEPWVIPSSAPYYDSTSYVGVQSFYRLIIVSS